MPLEIDRRTAVKLFGIGGIAVALRGIFSELWKWGTSVQEATPEEHSAYPKPGWLQTDLPNRPELINADNGSQDYLHYMVLNHPVLKESFTRAFKKLLIDTPPEGGKKLGDAFLDFFAIAKQVLIDMHPNTPPTMDNIALVAVMTQAAVYSPYFSYADITEQLKITLTFPEPADKDVWWLKALDEKIPHLFPADPATCYSEMDRIYRCIGGDRTIHFSQHMCLAFLMLYCKLHGLQDAERVPNFSKVETMFLPMIDQIRIFVMDQTGGWFWEAKETLDQLQGNATRDEKGNVIPTGFIDPYNVNDLQANKMGALAGLFLGGGNLTKDMIQELANELNRL